MIDRLNARLKGCRTYLLALILALPDILDGLAGVSFDDVLPPGWGSKLGLALAVGRIVMAATRSRLPAEKDAG